MSSENKTMIEKFEIEFSQKTINILDKLKNELCKSSREDVLRLSLKLLNFVVEQGGKGGIAVIENPKGNATLFIKELQEDI